MSEIHSTEKLDNNSARSFDPDKRIERNDNISVRDSYDPDKRIGAIDNAAVKSFFERMKAVDERNDRAEKNELDDIYSNKNDDSSKLDSETDSAYQDSEYYEEWLANQSELYGSGITFEEYEHQCQVRDYGLTKEEMDSGDNEDF